jgi:hypothetical protein
VVAINGFPLTQNLDEMVRGAEDMLAVADAKNQILKVRNPNEWQRLQELGRRYLDFLRAPINVTDPDLEGTIFGASCLDGQFDYLLEDAEDRGRVLAEACYGARKDWLERATRAMGMLPA